MSEPSLEEKMAALQAKFKGQLKERYESIALPWQEYLDSNNHEALINAHMAAHKMAGSAATFGFTEVSKLAKEAEYAMDPLIADTSVEIDEASRALISSNLEKMQQLVEAG